MHAWDSKRGFFVQGCQLFTAQLLQILQVSRPWPGQNSDLNFNEEKYQQIQRNILKKKVESKNRIEQENKKKNYKNNNLWLNNIRLG